MRDGEGMKKYSALSCNLPPHVFYITTLSEMRYEELEGMQLARHIEFFGTDTVDVDLESDPKEARYIHYRKL